MSLREAYANPPARAVPRAMCDAFGACRAPQLAIHLAGAAKQPAQRGRRRTRRARLVPSGNEAAAIPPARAVAKAPAASPWRCQPP